MVLFASVMLVLVVAGQSVVASQSSDKIATLEKQVESLTNLVHAQSNIMSRFSCQGGGAPSNPTSECILKIANQAKQISKLEADLKSLQILAGTKGKEIQQLKTSVADLNQRMQSQETKSASLDRKYAAEVSKLRSEIQNVDQKTNTLTNSVNQLGTKVKQVSGQWPSGSYCILASGSCPTGFTRRSGYLRAIKLYAGTTQYINQGTFGDSKIKCHGSCGQYGQWTGELYINACCK